MRLGFREKMLGVVAVSAVALGLVIVASRLITRRVDGQLATLRDRLIPRLDLEPRLKNRLDRLSRAFEDAVTARDPSLFDTAAQQKRAFLDALAAAEPVLDHAQATGLREALEAYDASASDVSRRLIARETGVALVDAMGAMQKKLARVNELLPRVAGLDRRDLSVAFGAAASASAQGDSYRVWIGLACIAAVLLMSLQLSRSLFGSLGALAEGFRRFGEGDFRPMPVAGSDEIADVARRANQMAESLGRAQAQLLEARAQLEVQLRRSEARFARLSESGVIGVVHATITGEILDVNDAFLSMLGYEREELLGGHCDLSGLTPLEWREADRRATERIRSDGVAPPREKEYLRKDGSRVPVLKGAALLAGTAQEVIAFVLDMTERRRAERALHELNQELERRVADRTAQLQVANRELEAFSYSVAHDLRAPLRGVSGFAEVLLVDHRDRLNDEGRDCLAEIQASAKEMAHLIDALLSLSRVTRAALHTEPVDLAALARSIVEDLAAAQPRDDYDLLVASDLRAEADPDLARVVLENLLGNAWKFTGKVPRPRIEVGAGAGAERAFFVKDNGAGFDPAYAGKLFAPFQRLHAMAEFPGTGIGLATVQRIIHRHGGRIWAEGAVGAGATFYFTFGSDARGKPV